MSNLLPVALYGLAGVLVGGAWSMRRQGAPASAAIVLVLLALMAFAAATLRLIYGGG
jgi:hypothetical protein